MISVWNATVGTVSLRNGLSCGRNEEKLDLTILVVERGSGRLGKARSRDRVILDGRIRGLG